MTTKIAIKPQPEYTADELRALDEWAAGFVGRELVYLGFDEELKAPIDQESGSLWHPTSTNAPLWQLGMILEKASFELSVAFDRIKAKSFSVGDYTEDGAWFTLKNPATVLAAIMQVENE